MISLIAAVSAALAVSRDDQDAVTDEDPTDWSHLASVLAQSAGESFGADGDLPFSTPQSAPTKTKKLSATEVANHVAEEFLKMDRGVIPDHLLLAVLLSGTTRGDPTELALRILRSVDGKIERVTEPTALEEAGIKAIGIARLLAATEFSRRVIARVATSQSTIINTAQVAVEIGKSLSLGRLEILSAIYLDRRMRYIGARTLSVGSDAFTVVDPRMILRPALELGAHAFILFHNHPSGDPSPSTQDLEVTRRVARACGTMGIQLVDHIVLSDTGRYISLAERGELPAWSGEVGF